MMFRRKSTFGPVVPLTDADRQAARAIAEQAGPLSCDVHVTAQGVLVMRALGGHVLAMRVVRALRSAGYEAHRAGGQVCVTGVAPTPHAATVAEIDARIDELDALRAEAQASNRLAVEA